MEEVMSQMEASNNVDLEAVKDSFLDAFNDPEYTLEGMQLPSFGDKQIENLGKALFPDRVDGPFTFVFECIRWKGDTDQTKKHKYEKEPFTGMSFVEAVKQAFAWRERYLYDIYDVAILTDIQ
jgi:hypothetical protein